MSIPSWNVLFEHISLHVRIRCPSPAKMCFLNIYIFTDAHKAQNLQIKQIFAFAFIFLIHVRLSSQRELTIIWSRKNIMLRCYVQFVKSRRPIYYLSSVKYLSIMMGWPSSILIFCPIYGGIPCQCLCSCINIFIKGICRGSFNSNLLHTVI